MATKPRTTTKQRSPELDDAARFEAWLHDFDTRHAELTVRLDALLRSLDINPAKTERETV
jgi:hypothetical protein